MLIVATDISGVKFVEGVGGASVVAVLSQLLCKFIHRNEVRDFK